MSRLFDPQFANVVDYDCFSQVVFEDIEDYVRMKEDAFYLERARGDHENFADTKRSRYELFFGEGVWGCFFHAVRTWIGGWVCCALGVGVLCSIGM